MSCGGMLCQLMSCHVISCRMLHVSYFSLHSWMAPELFPSPTSPTDSSLITPAFLIQHHLFRMDYVAHPISPCSPHTAIDIYALGLVIWSLVSAQLYPYDGIHPTMLPLLLSQHVRPIISHPCPKALQRLIYSCWQTEYVIM